MQRRQTAGTQISVQTFSSSGESFGSFSLSDTVTSHKWRACSLLATLLLFTVMAVTGSQRSERSLILSQIEKIENSHTLHSSESLRKLFRYLADHCIEHPSSPLKEYQIATEVFGRPSDFDPQFDSAIRVQAGRLRQKLSEYYAFEGAEDPFLVEMPKGAYLLSFHLKMPDTAKDDGQKGPELVTSQPRPQRTSPLWPIASLSLALLLVAAVAVIFIILSEKRKDVGGEPGAPVTGVLATFWKPFISNPEQPWVIFSNGAFVGRPETGMRYYNATRDLHPPMILDHYTGVGEVLAVHNLDHVFGQLHREIRVKRGSLFSLDDAKNNDLIFVGSPAENLTLRDIPGTKEFVFQRLRSGKRQGDLAIADLHVQPGEPAYFLGSPATSPLTEDYSVIALVKGMDPAHSVLILAGTTTLGTEAAVEFVCDESSLKQLLQSLKMTGPNGIKPFEAVLRVKVTRGVPVETSVVAVRTTP